jgi:sortase A
VLRWTERALVLAGGSMLFWCAVLVTDAALSQRAAQLALETAARDDTAVAVNESPATAAGPAAGSRVLPPQSAVTGAAVAALSIPRIRLSAVVLHGSDDRTLRRGPGHLENTAFPGEPGNVVIAGHRDSFFRPLRKISIGDDIFLETPRGRFHYRVSSLRVVAPRDVSVLQPTGAAELTLITCYPFSLIGNAPDRFVVRARQVDAGGSRLAAAATFPDALASAPAIEPPRAARPPAGRNSAAVEERSVRQAIERFRVTYNARLITRPEPGIIGPLGLEPCEVSVGGEIALATCSVSLPSPEGESQTWSFIFRRSGTGWAIRSIAMDRAGG